MARRHALAAFAAALIGAAATSAAPSSATADASAEPDPNRLVRSCTPELVHSLRPGREMDATSVGQGFAPNLEYTDADGNPRPATPVALEWSARAIIDEPARGTGVHPDIGGYLDLTIDTAAGEELMFEARCIAAAGGSPFGLVVYANGIVTGWPGSEARRALVHFESYTDGSAYIALVDGWDCALNHDARVVTDEPYVSGTKLLSGLPAQFAFAETDCGHRFGDPFPASRRRPPDP